MAFYEKKVSIFGNWVKGKDLVSGSKAVLVSETNPIKSQFKDKNGNEKTQDVAKIKFDGKDEELNISLNRATIDGLIDAFGNDSKNWINKPLTVITDKVSVGGKRVIAVYLVAEGYILEEDGDGYLHIFKKGQNDGKIIKDEEINMELDAIAAEEENC